MKLAAEPLNEQEGSAGTISEYHFSELLSEADFEDFIRLAAEICHTPVSLVNIIDNHKHCFKPAHEAELSAMTCHSTINNHSIHSPGEVFIINDLAADNRFTDAPITGMSPDILFYAAIPLAAIEGYTIGTLSIWDHKPGTLNDSQVAALQSLARQIVARMEQKRKIIQTNKKNAELKRAYSDLEQFSYTASHDLKSPLNNIISLTHLLKDNYATKLDEEGNEYISYLNDTAYQLSDLINGILHYSKSSQLLSEDKEPVHVATLIREVTELLKIPEKTILFERDDREIYTSRVALKQILLNLLQNALKFDDKMQVKIEVAFHETKDAYIFEVKDNGPGIAPGNLEKIFDLFKTLSNKDKSEQIHGIGLAIVKRLVEKSGGAIKVVSELSKGSTFIFSLPKDS